MKKYKKNFFTFKDALFKSSSRLGIGKGLSKYSLWDNWQKIVPSTLSKHTRPIRWQGDILVIGTTTSAWTQELAFLKPKLINKIKTYDSKIKIKDIWFESGHSFEDKEENKAGKPFKQELSQDQLNEIEEWTKDIKDLDLKNTIKSAIRTVFERKKRKSSTI